MSRIGKKPVQIPQGVEVTVEGKTVRVSGPKGEITSRLPEYVTVRTEEDRVFIERKNNSKPAKSLHGTLSREVRNAVRGASEGWEKTLELVGAGYRARLEGETLVLTVGYSHPVRVEPPEGVSFSVEENKVRVSGVDKTLVGQVAANIRAVRPPEPYKGKGIKYEDEAIRRKAGKALKAGPAA